LVSKKTYAIEQFIGIISGSDR